MLVVDNTKGFVNPLQLAIRSQSAGHVSKNLGLIIPQVIRPELISDQLRGCGCGLCGGAAEPGIGYYGRIEPGAGMRGGKYVTAGKGTTALVNRGMGQIDPVTAIAGISTAITQAKNLYQSLLAALGIGAGAREANIIVPIQNQITNNVLVPAVNLGESPSRTCAQMLAWQKNIQVAHDQFQAWLTNTHWADGRAAQQALNWLNGPLPASSTQPSWFHQVQSDFNNQFQRECGSVLGGTTVVLPGGLTVGSNTMLLLAAGLGAYLLLK
jgi:hypothetical protein